MEFKELQFKAESVSGDTFAGFASTSDLDKGMDIITKGAYGRTLAERGGKVKMLWNHKSDLMPIGVYTKMEERESGLYVEGKISDTALGRDAKTLLADGALDSMSIGYVVKEADYNDDGVRVIKDLDLYEVSLVNFPMNEKALITSVKMEDLFDVRELEAKLREVGYSNSQAKRMAGASISSLREVDDEKKAFAELQQALSNFNDTLRGN